MTLLTVRWKGKPASPELAVDPIETEVDIYVGEQNQEDFLKKNWKGQVSFDNQLMILCQNYTGARLRMSYFRFRFCLGQAMSKSPTASKLPISWRRGIRN